jgi:hypothetical protein
MNMSQAKRPNPELSIENLMPARFLKPYHLIDRKATEFTAAIREVRIERVGPPDRQDDMPVLYFANPKIPAPYLLSAKTDLNTLRDVYGATQIGDLIGMHVTICLDEWRGRAVLRIKPVKPAQPKADQAGAETKGSPLVAGQESASQPPIT